MNEQSQQPPWEPGAAEGSIIPALPRRTSASEADDAPDAGKGAPPEEAPPRRLPRLEALDLLGRMKATLVVGSVVAFGVFLGLAATHVTGVTARAAEANGTNSQDVSPTRPPDDGGFFTGGQNGGFGVGPPGSRGPASGTSVS